MKIILGTASKYRKEVFEEMGYTDFEVMVADINEKAIRFDDPETLALALANAKADALLKRINEPAILITADQVVSWNGEIREKPENENQAREYLRSYHLAPAYTISAVAVTNTTTRKRASGANTVKIVFAQIPDAVIEQLIKQGDIFNKAGGFEVRDPLLKPYVKNIEGTMDSVMGLPKELMERLMEEARNPTPRGKEKTR